jgi:hypothetical protein
MADTIIYKCYKDNAGNLYRVRVKSIYGVMASLGWAADDTTKPFLPKPLKMRYLTLTDATSKRHRTLHVGDVAGTSWNNFGASLTLANADGTTSAYTITGSVGEKWRKAS